MNIFSISLTSNVGPTKISTASKLLKCGGKKNSGELVNLGGAGMALLVGDVGAKDFNQFEPFAPAHRCLALCDKRRPGTRSLPGTRRGLLSLYTSCIKSEAFETLD
jgi:hypothetical protein